MAHHVRITAALPLAMLSTLAAGSCAPERDTSLSSSSPSAEAQQRETISTAEPGSAACAGNTGEVLAVYHGVPFYSNGSCTGTWAGVYQCPEVVKRYNLHMDWHGHARTYCDPDAARERNLIFLPNQRESPGRNGDIVAFDGPSCGKGVGHVGLRCGTPDAAHWQLCDQNRAWSAFDNPLELTRTGGALDTFDPSCLVCGVSRPGWDFTDVHGLGTESYAWTLNGMSLVSVDAAAIRLDPGPRAPQLVSPSGLRLNPDPTCGGYGKLHVFMKSRAANRALRVHFTTLSDGIWDDAKAQSAPIPWSGSWNDVVVELAANPRWINGGRIDQIRIDPVRQAGFSGDEDALEVDWMRFDP
jgi:hypothetical protein